MSIVVKDKKIKHAIACEKKHLLHPCLQKIFIYLVFFSKNYETVDNWCNVNIYIYYRVYTQQFSISETVNFTERDQIFRIIPLW